MPTKTRKGQVSREEAEIRAILETVHKAHRDKDARAIVAQYARNAVVFDLAPPLVSGIGTDPRKLAAWLDTWDGPVDLEAHDLSVSVGGDVAFAHGFYRLRGTPKAAGEATSLWMRATVCLRREAGAWRIVHEHTSVPFYMDGSFRAALDLEPGPPTP